MIEELLTRQWQDLMGRISGPMTFRLLLQPAMATFFAIRDGLKDARKDRPAYFWALFTRPDLRRDLLHQGWQVVARVFVLAIIMDAIYQFIVLRGPVNRLARRWQHRGAASGPGSGRVG